MARFLSAVIFGVLHLPNEALHPTTLHVNFNGKVFDKADVMRNMSVEDAVNLVIHKHGIMAPEFAKFIQGQLQRQTLGEVSQHTFNTQGSNITSIRILLNSMIEESVESLETETDSCDSFEKTQRKILHDLGFEISEANSKYAAAVEVNSASSGRISEIEQSALPQARSSLERTEKTCESEIRSLKEQLWYVTNDLEIVVKLKPKICPDYDPNNASSTPFLLQCPCNDGRAVYSLPQENAINWKGMSDGARKNMQSALRELFQIASQDSDSATQPTTISPDDSRMLSMLSVHAPIQCDELLHGDNGTDYRGCQTTANNAKTCLPWNEIFNESTINTSYANESLEENFCRNPFARRSSIWCYTDKNEISFCAPVDMSKEVAPVVASECKINNQCKLGAGSCDRLLDKFSEVEGDIASDKRHLENDLSRTEDDCREQTSSLKDSISMLETELSEENTKLAGAVATMAKAQSAASVAHASHSDTKTAYMDRMKECCDNKNLMLSEECALKKIRGELYKMQKDSTQFADCEVGPWVHGECTHTCGGGKVGITREVTVEQAGGAACPPLSKEETCNDFECPIDCKVDSWSTWSACTAECGGGVESRSRAVDVFPEFNGLACEDTKETRECNTDACDAPCVLDDWTEWTECDKFCGGGFQERTRGIKEPAKGDGTCAKPLDATRNVRRSCNTQDCASAVATLPGWEDSMKGLPITCTENNVDLVFVIDSSGSLRKQGWNTQKLLLEKLVPNVRVSEDGVHVSTVDYSDQIETTFLNADGNAVINTIKTLRWFARGTPTGKALKEAKAILEGVSARRTSRNVVVLLTDGKAYNMEAAGEAAQELQTMASVIVVQEGAALDSFKDEIVTWASSPYHYVRAEFAELASVKVQDMIMANICRYPGVPTTTTTVDPCLGVACTVKVRVCTATWFVFCVGWGYVDRPNPSAGTCCR